MSNYLERAGLKVDEALTQFIENEALPGSGIEAEAFWQGLGELVETAMPRNAELLMVREDLAAQDRRLAQGERVRGGRSPGL